MQECTKRNVSTETKCRFHVFQDERFVDLNLYQYGWEQTEPLHSYGPYARNHYLFHYVISGKGLLLANGQEYAIEGGHGFQKLRKARCSSLQLLRSQKSPHLQHFLPAREESPALPGWSGKWHIGIPQFPKE